MINKCLTSKIRRDKLCIRDVDMSNSKYQGMNYYANKELKTGYKMKPRDIILHKGLSQKEKKITLKHELIERNLMRKGMKYKNADKIAERYEAR